jgi:membrane protein
MWGVRVAEQQSALQVVRSIAYKRVISFAMVLACGGFLLFTVLLQAIFARLGGAVLHVLERMIGTSWVSLAILASEQLAITFIVLTALFATIYRVLPDAKIHWSDVGVGAMLTATLVLSGTWLLGFYLARIAPSWLQGTLGSVAAFMLWTYYLAQVFLLGAAFTRAWSNRAGALVEPEDFAELSQVPPPPA